MTNDLSSDCQRAPAKPLQCVRDNRNIVPEELDMECLRPLANIVINYAEVLTLKLLRELPAAGAHLKSKLTDERRLSAGLRLP